MSATATLEQEVPPVRAPASTGRLDATSGDLRVAYLVDRYPVLSQTFVTGEVAELRRQGVQVVVVALHAGDPGLDEAPDLVLDDLARPRWLLGQSHLRWALRHPLRYRAFRQRVAELRSEVDEGDKRFDWRVLPDVASSLAAQQVQVLHAHFAWAGAAAAACLGALLGRPWTLTVHANDIFSATRNLPPKLEGCARLVTVCDYNVRFLREELGVTRPIDVVVCGVRVPDDAPVAKDVDVVAVGRLVPKKGFDTLVRAVAALPAGSRPLVEIVGDGPQRADLEQLLDALGVRDSVRLAGPLDHARTLDRIARARVLCLPARIAADGDRDSMPVVVKEALARAVPVVATAVVAIPEMVDESVGALVPPDDPAALAAALTHVLRLPEQERQALGRAGRARAAQRFTLEGETARLRSLFLELTRGAP